MYKDDNTRCPLCDKLLIGGKCNDCGYYVDNHVMANQHTGFYTNDTGNVDVHKVYSDGHHGSLNIRKADGSTMNISAHDSDCRADEGTKNDASFAILRVISVILIMCFQVWGFVISIILLKKVGDTKGLKIIGAVFGVVLAISVIFLMVSIAAGGLAEYF